MFKGKGGLIFLLIVVALVVIVFLLLRQGGQLPSLLGRGEATPAIPLDLLRFIPPGWEVQSDDQVECDFDDDPELERLLIYRYNTTTLQKPLEPAGETEKFGPFGGAIFDTQSSSLAPQPEPPGAYRPGNIVPYLLLPDFYPEKGEGYLGDTDVELRLFPVTERGAPCRADEINVFGFTYGPLPTRLSIFRWQSREEGYQGVHFAGNARVESDIMPEGGNQISQVTTYNRLLNHRSVLCEVNRYSRVEAPNSPAQFAFLSDPPTIDFCFDAPPEPVYPEGIAVALLRGRNSGTGQPTDYLLENAILPEELRLDDPSREPYNILSVGNPSFVVPQPSDGGWCTVEQVGMALAGPAPTVAPTVTPFGTPPGTPTVAPTREYTDRLWCGRERARIETRIELDGVTREVDWSLISVRPDRPDGGVYWRVQEVDLR